MMVVIPSHVDSTTQLHLLSVILSSRVHCSNTYVEDKIQTKDTVHLYKCDVMVVQAAVFEEAPELHAIHDKRVVRTLLVAKGAVEVVDLTQVRDVAYDDEDRLKQTRIKKGSCGIRCSRVGR